MTTQSDSIHTADSRNSINHSASFLFEDKGGLVRFGGMAASVTAVAQVAEQFIGNDLRHLALQEQNQLLDERQQREPEPEVKE